LRRRPGWTVRILVLALAAALALVAVANWRLYSNLVALDQLDLVAVGLELPMYRDFPGHWYTVGTVPARLLPRPQSVTG